VKREKGKSRKRIKDWINRYESGVDGDGEAISREALRRRQVKLGQDNFAVRSGRNSEGKTMEGMVTGVFRHAAVVRTEKGDLKCGIAKTYRPPGEYKNTTPLAVGDIVNIALPEAKHTGGKLELDRNREAGMIISRSPRKTLLARPEIHKGKQRDKFSDPFIKVIAVNVEILLVVASIAKPKIRRGLVDRFMIVAERGGLEVVVVMNKIDTGKMDDSVRTIMDDAERLGARVFPCSALKGTGIEELSPVLSGKRSVLAGASGAGKTTLVNALIPGVNASTKPVREKDDRGRHTTTQSRVYNLPEGGLIIDTPGIRELGVGIDPEELRWYYPDFDEFSAGCRFNNCTHSHEPECGVVRAVESGKIPRHRYESYLRILETIE